SPPGSRWWPSPLSSIRASRSDDTVKPTDRDPAIAPFDQDFVEPPEEPPPAWLEDRGIFASLDSGVDGPAAGVVRDVIADMPRVTTTAAPDAEPLGESAPPPSAPEPKPPRPQPVAKAPSPRRQARAADRARLARRTIRRV